MSRLEIGGFEFGGIDPGDGPEGVGIERERSEVTGSELRSEGGLPDGGVLRFRQRPENAGGGDLGEVEDCKPIFEGEALFSVELFDEYAGEQVSEGKKSLAFSVSYQARDRTLTEKDVAKARGRILGLLQKDLGAELRG